MSPVTLNWNSNTEPDLAGYNVYRKAEGGAYGAKLNASLLVTSDYVDNTYVAGTSVVYGVTAVDSTGNESTRAEAAVRVVAATEAGAASDTPTVRRTIRIVATETAAASDTAAPSVKRSIARAEAGAAGDSAAVGRRLTWVLGSGGFDSASDEPIFAHLDTPYGLLEKGGADSTAPTDSATATTTAQGTEQVTATEATAPTDTGTPRVVRRLSSTEAGAATDSATATTTGQGIEQVAATDSSAPTDTGTPRFVRRLPATEAGASSDSATATPGGKETVSATDSSTAGDSLLFDAFVYVPPAPPPPIPFASVLEGQLGRVQFQPHLYLSNISGEEIAPLTTVDTASVNMDNERDAAWSLNATMRATDEFNPANDYVKAVVDVKVGSVWERYAMGLYRFLGFDEDRYRGQRTWKLTGFSLEDVLANRTASRSTQWPQIVGYVVAPGTKILAEVARILTVEFGVPQNMLRFPSSADDVTLVKGIILDIAQSRDAVVWLNIVNTLLDAGAFTRIKTTKDGRWFTRKKRDLIETPASVRYGPSSATREDLVNADEVVGLARDFSEFANEVLVVSSDTRQIPPVAAKVRNSDPNHPYSTANYEVRTRTVDLQVLVAKPEAVAYATEELSRRMAIPDSYTFETILDPRMDVMGVTHAHYREANGDPLFVGKFWQHGFGVNLAPLSNMEHSVGTLDPTEPVEVTPPTGIA